MKEVWEKLKVKTIKKKRYRLFQLQVFTFLTLSFSQTSQFFSNFSVFLKLLSFSQNSLILKLTSIRFLGTWFIWKWEKLEKNWEKFERKNGPNFFKYLIFPTPSFSKNFSHFEIKFFLIDYIHPLCLFIKKNMYLLSNK